MFFLEQDEHYNQNVVTTRSYVNVSKLQEIEMLSEWLECNHTLIKTRRREDIVQSKLLVTRDIFVGLMAFDRKLQVL